ncbi:hypothetical protein HQ45_06770 [Porphyromonas crevioricanis]|uniref:Uncharacterized protein n=1 Tax=Porphyromonas crevioricanis JCM 15906 TaxID=1305617 RepID=S4PGA7_9PORP|nr:hypothetical protein [Porphyromonas crevioricanis]KGN89685.1 hypothetical protein HQ45_06770 [Porphyromonas crevioricanis]GAD04519.1 hypothetical protein PORCRE_205 [Porphyromonas crevioricanis JCM 15906]SJZ77918.1 hypothetical protein SAMN02745203_00834 [Porphyromonas crevioricanis]
MSNAEIKDVRLARYEATGFYYIDDDSEDEASDALAERYLEYFFFFDDGGGSLCGICPRQSLIILCLTTATTA